MSDSSLPLLNIFEIEMDGQTRHFVGFMETVRAGAQGIPEHAIVAEFTPGPAGEFDPQSIRLNSAFLDAVITYMNSQVSERPEVASEARKFSGGWLALVDPRYPQDAPGEVPPSEILGAFAVNEEGSIVASSFQYNGEHEWFSTNQGVSGLFFDKSFYEWLHSQASAQ